MTVDHVVFTVTPTLPAGYIAPLHINSIANTFDFDTKDSYVTASLSFTTGRWYVLCFISRKATLPEVPATVTSASFTWTLENAGGLSVVPTSGQDANMSVWTTYAGSTISEAVTIGPGVSGASTDWTEGVWHVFEVIGADSSDLIEGVYASGTGTDTALAATLGAFNASADRPVAFFHDDATTDITLEAGWTQVGSQVTANSPNGKSAVAWHSTSQDTSVTATGHADGWGVIALKLKAPLAGGASSVTHIVLTVTPTLPQATVTTTDAVRHVVLEVTPSLPAASVVAKHIVTHIIFTVTPSLPAALVSEAVTSVTPARKKTIIGPTRPYARTW